MIKIAKAMCNERNTYKNRECIKNHVEKFIKDNIDNVSKYKWNITNQSVHLLTLKIFKVPLSSENNHELHLMNVLLNNVLVLDVIYNNFSIFERMYFNSKYLVEIFIVYASLFIEYFWDASESNDILTSIYTLKTGPFSMESIAIITDEFLSIHLDKIISNITMTTIVKRCIQCKIVSNISRASLAKVIGIYSKIIKMEIMDTL